MKIIYALLLAILAVAFGPAYAGFSPAVQPATIVIGASNASDNWPLVYDIVQSPKGGWTKSSEEAQESRNTILGGRYVGLCEALQVQVGIKRKLICQAQAGAMGTDVALEFLVFPDVKKRIVASGYLTQLERGLRQATTMNGELVADSLIITLANGGVADNAEVKKAITLARKNGIKKIIVQKYPAKVPDFGYQRMVALDLFGQFWGNIILRVGHEYTQAEWNTLIVAQRNALLGYKGIVLRDFYQAPFQLCNKKTCIPAQPMIWPVPKVVTTIDGVHVLPWVQQAAARTVQKLLPRSK